MIGGGWKLQVQGQRQGGRSIQLDGQHGRRGRCALQDRADERGGSGAIRGDHADLRDWSPAERLGGQRHFLASPRANEDGLCRTTGRNLVEHGTIARTATDHERASSAQQPQGLRHHADSVASEDADHLVRGARGIGQGPDQVECRPHALGRQGLSHGHHVGEGSVIPRREEEREARAIKERRGFGRLQFHAQSQLLQYVRRPAS